MAGRQGGRDPMAQMGRKFRGASRKKTAESLSARSAPWCHRQNLAKVSSLVRHLISNCQAGNKHSCEGIFLPGVAPQLRCPLPLSLFLLFPLTSVSPSLVKKAKPSLRALNSSTILQLRRHFDSPILGQ